MPTSTKSSLTGQSDLRINGMPVSGEWELRLTDDYVDATTFGDTNKTYLAGQRVVDLFIKDWGGVATGSGSPYKPEVPEFDFEAAREMYEDDPVALAIISRMLTLETALDMAEMTISEQHAQMRAQTEKSNEAREAYALVVKENQKMRSMLHRDPPDGGQWPADDPVKKRNTRYWR